jgi:hypothetical protein
MPGETPEREPGPWCASPLKSELEESAWLTARSERPESVVNSIKDRCRDF